MKKSSLSLLISMTLSGMVGVAAAQTTTDPEDVGVAQPPPAAAASVRGQTHIPDRMTRDDRYVDESMVDDPAELQADVGEAYDDDIGHKDEVAHPQVQTQSPPNDPTHPQRLHSGFEGERTDADEDDFAGAAAVAGPRQDAVDYAEQPISDDELRQTRSTDIAMERERTEADGPMFVREAEGEPFADTAGTEGFSEGATASQAQQRFQRLDTDGDGTLSEQELMDDTALADNYAEYDINGDGLIAKNEFQSYFAAQQWLEGDPERERRVASGDLEDMEEADFDDDQP